MKFIKYIKDVSFLIVIIYLLSVVRDNVNLIEQLQYENFSSSNTLDLNFNHPVKELIWTSSLNQEVGSFQEASINNFIPLHSD